MIVEWFGGPRDGEQVILVPGTREIVLADPPEDLVARDFGGDAPIAEPSYRELIVPVRRGRILWNERWYREDRRP